jgi:hypothetical protein
VRILVIQRVLQIVTTLLCVLGLMATATNAPLTGDASTNSRAVKATCPVATLIGVRGSGETSGFGSTVGDIVTQVASKKPWMTTEHLDYKAIGVPTWKVFWRYATYNGDYKRSIEDGRRRLITRIRSITTSGCGATTQILLAGFSQGAHVVGDVYQDHLTRAERNRVAAIALVGDPRFRGAEGSPPNVGTYDARLNGVWDGFKTPRRLSAADSAKIRSYCIARDPVCNLNEINLERCLVGGCVHSRYAKETYHGGDRYTRMAAAWLRRHVPNPLPETTPPHEVDPRCIRLDTRPRATDAPEWLGPLSYQLTGVWDAPPVGVFGSFRNRATTATSIVSLSATIFPEVNAVAPCQQYLRNVESILEPDGMSDYFNRRVGYAYSRMGYPEAYTCFVLAALGPASYRSDFSTPLCFYRDGDTAPPFVVDWEAVWQWGHPTFVTPRAKAAGKFRKPRY